MSITALSRFIATVGYVGYLRPAPGTWGSLAGCVLAVPIIIFGSFQALLVASAIIFVIGIWATQVMTKDGPHDPSEIVIDEVAGQWIALVPFALVHFDFQQITSPPDTSIWTWVVPIALAFGLFRLFDIWKPWPVSWADRRDDAWGVMLDDILAGVLAAVCWAVIVQQLLRMSVGGWYS